MPPAKTRVAQDDSRSEGSASRITGTNATSGRGKRAPGLQHANSSLKDATIVDDAQNGNGQGSSGSSWATENLSLLQKYRAAHKIDTPTSFGNIRNQFSLTNPGIGRQSPTMARSKAQRKVTKDQLASAVRKNFNAAAVNEIDVMVDSSYKIRNQDKAFRIRSAPSKSK